MADRKKTNGCWPLPRMDTEQTARYHRFRVLLDHNRAALSDAEVVLHKHWEVRFHMNYKDTEE